jgi:DNA-binding transcriptional MerR regulator
MGRYRISELAERSGFPASTLRFYEQEGLLPAAARTPGGYRSYDEHAVERLRFIARAKQLDLPLDEIRDLAAVWDGGSCSPVKARLDELLAAKIADVDARMADLTAFRSDLAAARDGLGQNTPDGPCDDNCGCVSPPPTPTARRTLRLLAPRPTHTLPIDLAPTEGEPIACTLGGTDQQTRIRDWTRLLEAATRREQVSDEMRFVLPADPELIAEAARLAALEQGCCRFMAFTIDLPPGAAVLTVRAPGEARDMLDLVFGAQP